MKIDYVGRNGKAVHGDFVFSMLGQPLAWLAEGHASRVYASRVYASRVYASRVYASRVYASRVYASRLLITSGWYL
jgi:hypothetical protein